MKMGLLKRLSPVLLDRKQHFLFNGQCLVKRFYRWPILDRVKTVAGFLSFTNMIGHRSTEPIMATWHGEREIGKSEMNNYKRHKPTNIHHPCHPRSKVTFYSSGNL